LHTGARVYVAGRLKTSRWEDAQGTPQDRTELALNELIMLDGPPRRDDGDDGGGNAIDAQTPPPAPTPAPPRRRKKMTTAELAAQAADLL
jgi:single-stranded DNA-binding protein